MICRTAQCGYYCSFIKEITHIVSTDCFFEFQSFDPYCELCTQGKQTRNTQDLRQGEWRMFKQGVSNHGKPGKVMEFRFFSRPGEVIQIDSRFWKIHKKSWKLKDILL